MPTGSHAMKTKAFLDHWRGSPIVPQDATELRVFIPEGAALSLPGLSRFVTMQRRLGRQRQRYCEGPAISSWRHPHDPPE